MDEFVIVVDTREQAPFTFQEINPPPSIIYGGLRTGDYSIQGYELRIAIERKSLIDLFGSVGSGRKRFQREMERMACMEFGAVVCEADWLTILRQPPSQSRMNPKSVYATILAWMQRYHVHWIMCPNRAFAEKTTYRMLERWYLDEAKGLHRISLEDIEDI